MILPSIALAGFLSLNPLPIVVSTDVGCEMDDQWAIVHLCLSPTIEVRAIITSHSPGFAIPKAETSARTARAVLDVLPLAKRPSVIAGANEPLIDRKTARISGGSDRLLVESKGFTSNRRLTIVQIGPATDVASALLQDPTLSDRIAVVSMAFDEWPKGGDPFNVKNDVAAWQVLMDSNTPLTIVDGSVSLRHLKLTRTQANGRFGALGAAGAALVGYLTNWLDRAPDLARSITGSSETWPVWDCGTVALLLGYARTEVYPRPRLLDDRTFDHTQPRGTLQWVTSIDSDALWQDLGQRLMPLTKP